MLNGVQMKVNGGYTSIFNGIKKYVLHLFSVTNHIERMAQYGHPNSLLLKSE